MSITETQALKCPKVSSEFHITVPSIILAYISNRMLGKVGHDNDQPFKNCTIGTWEWMIYLILLVIMDAIT